MTAENKVTILIRWLTGNDVTVDSNISSGTRDWSSEFGINELHGEVGSGVVEHNADILNTAIVYKRIVNRLFIIGGCVSEILIWLEVVGLVEFKCAILCIL